MEQRKFLEVSNQALVAESLLLEGVMEQVEVATAVPKAVLTVVETGAETDVQ